MKNISVSANHCWGYDSAATVAVRQVFLVILTCNQKCLSWLDKLPDTMAGRLNESLVYGTTYIAPC